MNIIPFIVLGMVLGWFMAWAKQDQEREKEFQRQLDESIIGPPKSVPTPPVETVLYPDELHFARPAVPDTMLWGNVPYYRPMNAITRFKFRNCSDEILCALGRQTQFQLDVFDSLPPSTDYKRCRVVAEFTGGFISSYDMEFMDASSDRTDIDLEIAFDLHDVKFYLDEPNH